MTFLEMERWGSHLTLNNAAKLKQYLQWLPVKFAYNKRLGSDLSCAALAVYLQTKALLIGPKQLP